MQQLFWLTVTFSEVTLDFGVDRGGEGGGGDVPIAGSQKNQTLGAIPENCT